MFGVNFILTLFKCRSDNSKLADSNNDRVLFVFEVNIP